MREDELKSYYGIYTDIWKVFRKYSAPTDEDSFWEALCAEAHEIYERYHRTMFVRRECLNLVDEIERICKANRPVTRL